MNPNELKREIEEINLMWGEDISYPAPVRPQAMSKGNKKRRESSAGKNADIAKRVPLAKEVPIVRKAPIARKAHTPKKSYIAKWAVFGIITCLIIFIIVLLLKERDKDSSMVQTVFGEQIQGIRESVYEKHPAWIEDFLTVNQYSRPGTKIGKVKNIFVHYTANPGTNARQNRSYFENLKDTAETSVSSHFIIGYEGEIIQCIPLDEMAYAVKTRNEDSISIECCYIAEDGSFTKETYDSLIILLGWLLDTYGLEPEDILRHYDCGGKKCPLYYTENEDKWEQLKREVGTGL